MKIWDQPTDFEVVTWAIDNGWARVEYTTFEGTPYTEWTYGTARWGATSALKEMRRQYAAAHRPPLAERIADEVLTALVESGLFDPTMAKAQHSAFIAAVQRVLDEEEDPSLADMMKPHLARAFGNEE